MLLLAGAATLLAAPVARARAYDETRAWYAEASVGTVQPGLGDINLGSGQNYSVHLGFRANRWVDVGLSLAWAQARANELALESNITSGGPRVRGALEIDRWALYGEAAARLYHFSLQESDVQDPQNESALRVGGEIGAGILYSRSTWWAGLGTELHAAIGNSDLAGGRPTFTTFNVFVGAPFPK